MHRTHHLISIMISIIPRCFRPFFHLYKVFFKLPRLVINFIFNTLRVTKNFNLVHNKKLNNIVLLFMIRENEFVDFLIE